MNNERMLESIRNLCKSMNMSTTKLEEELGFSQGLISRWKDKNPNIDRIIDIADYFHVSLDEVVGRNYFDNEFINKLFKETKNKSIKWNVYTGLNYEPKQYICERYSKKTGKKIMTSSDIDYYTFHFNEISYYCVFNNGYISIYGQYDDRIINPNYIKLFIQPTNDSELIEQEYSFSELYDLWLKVLYSIDEYCPDEIKAEEFKNAFVLNKSFTNSNNVLSGGSINDSDLDAIEKIISDPAVMKLMEIYSKPEFQELQRTFSNPEFQKTMQVANRLQKYFDKINK